MEWTDTALVLHVGRFREADLWVRLLALEQGLVTVFAFGGSRSRRRFTGCLDVFNVIRARVTASRDGQFLNMQESTLLEGPERLRRDWRRQGMAANCVRFMEALGVPPDASPFSFSLLRELLGLLENEERPPELAPLFFRFRLAAEQGYAPDLRGCFRCGKPLDSFERAYVLVGEGLACCPDCRPRGGMSLALGQESLDVLRKVQEYSPSRWAALEPSPDSRREAGRLIDAFVRYHLGLEWVNGRFRRNS